MKRALMVLAASVILLGLGAVAQAQDALPEAGDTTGNINSDEENVIYKKETSYDFEDDNIDGALVKPDGALVGGELHGKTSSLIKIRQDFVPEMLKSVEDL